MPLPHDRPGDPDERVLRQLVAALLFEGLIAPDRADAPDWCRDAIAWTAPRTGDRFRCRGSRGAFGRPRLVAGSIERRVGDGRWAPADLAAVLDGLDIAHDRRAAVLDELARTATFARWAGAVRRTVPRRTMGFAELDGALDEGHPYHPCFKARTGFSLADHAAYAPESAAPIRLVWLAIARDRLAQHLPAAEAAFLAAEFGADVAADLDACRAGAGASAESHGLLPLHPWQWDRLRDSALRPWLESGVAHGLGPAGDRYRATQSVRTLANLDRPERANVKLAMDMITTSARRTIEPHSVGTAPVLSAWLAAVIAADPVLAQRHRLTILPEYAGMIADRDGPLAGHLAVLWRRSAEAVLAPGEVAVPFNALMLVEDDGRAFVHDWIRDHGLLAWLDRLVEVAVLPVWHLLVAQGIGVEAHGQNMILVHRDGWPERLILRDFHESMEFCPAALTDPAAMPDFLALDPAYRTAVPDQYYWTQTQDPVRDLVTDALFVYNLADVVHCLASRHALPEAGLWDRIAARLAGHAAEHGLDARLDALGLGSRTVVTESLFTRKLFPDRTEPRHAVPNPLARLGRAERTAA